jgi:hypothetical protein
MLNLNRCSKCPLLPCRLFCVWRASVRSIVTNAYFWDPSVSANSVALVRERTIPTERPSLVGEVNANFWGYKMLNCQHNVSLRPCSRFLDRSRYFIFQVAPKLYSGSWVGTVPNPLLLRKYGSVGNRTRNLWICSQELWTLDHRDGPVSSDK